MSVSLLHPETDTADATKSILNVVKSIIVSSPDTFISLGKQLCTTGTVRES